MDLKVYFQKIRQAEAEIAEPDAVIISLDTADGGKAGARTEVPRHVAAKLFVEGKARLATTEEASEFRARMAEAKQAADQLAAAARMQVTVMTDADLRALKAGLRGNK